MIYFLKTDMIKKENISIKARNFDNDTIFDIRTYKKSIRDRMELYAKRENQTPDCGEQSYYVCVIF